MNVLITGANGQLGLSFANLTSQTMLQGSTLFFASREELDITNTSEVIGYLESHKIQVVVNTAAYTAVDRAEEEPEKAEAVNLEGVKCLAQACQAQDSWLIHVSTDYVFDGEKQSPYEESDVTNPLSVYGKTKLAGEKWLTENCPQVLILRTSWVFSQFGSNFLKTMINIASSRKSLRVVSDQWGTPTYAPHIAQTIMAIINYSKTAEKLSGIYHLSGSPRTNWSSFARFIFQTQGRYDASFAIPEVSDISTAQYLTLAPRPKNSVLSNNKLQQKLGIEPLSWELGVDLSVRELRQLNQ